MKFLMFIRHDESIRNEEIPRGLMEAMEKFVAEGFASGVLKDTAGLKPSAEGHRIRLSGGKLRAMDGPFAEAKEVIGGYAMVDVKSRQEALALATQFMELHRIHWPGFEAECEVRALDGV